VRAQQRGAFARGTQLGRYVVEGLIGKGGMAEVYLASQRGHADFHKRVVLKRMATDVRDVDDIDRMFAREAQTAARLSHPNVVQIFDYQCVDGEAFIVMEHLDGLSLLKLSTLMRAAGRELPVPAVLRFVADAARGLHAAHTHADERGQPSWAHPPRRQPHQPLPDVVRVHEGARLRHRQA
jgi:serine/threonine protein kinase